MSQELGISQVVPDTNTTLDLSIVGWHVPRYIAQRSMQLKSTTTKIFEQRKDATRVVTSSN